jgi:hypothetical protein
MILSLSSLIKFVFIVDGYLDLGIFGSLGF